MAGLLLAPGAGASSDHPALLALDRAATAGGLGVRRVDFPYRIAGRGRPDPPAVLVAAIQDQARELAAGLRTTTSRLVLGGRSMGGRICSEAVAAGLPAAGLALISYPLHAPGRSDRLRTEHFPRLSLPCLFVSGTRDAFATPDELRAATEAIPGAVSHAWIEGGDHGLRGHDAEVAELVAGWMRAQLGAA